MAGQERPRRATRHCPLLLIVDDDAALVAMLAADLSDRYAVIACSDSAVALERLRHDRPDFLLVDLLMPYPSGIRVLQESLLDPALRGTHAVAMTGCDSYELLDRVSRQFLVLRKPFAREDVIEALEHAGAVVRSGRAGR